MMLRYAEFLCSEQKPSERRHQAGCEVKEHIAEKTSWEIQWLMILSLSLIPGTE